jgi:RES domain-containing protein
MRVWRIATDTPDYVADDLTGTGARITGGRWNRPGQPVIYCASSPSLACLETLVHLGTGSLPMNRYLVAIDIPDAVRDAGRTETPSSLPVGWDATPAGKVSLDVGDAWLSARLSAVLVLPSSIVPEDPIILVNPRHPDSASLTAVKLRRWLYDPRLF